MFFKIFRKIDPWPMLLSMLVLGCSSGMVKNPCPDGQVVDGTCYPYDCAGRKCPDDFLCVDDFCVDIQCIGVQCDPGGSCAKGLCFPSDCLWRNCPGAGDVCIDEKCEQASCVGVECPQGQVCAGGNCYPKDCEVENCPGYGEICVNEECTDRSCIGVDCPEDETCAMGFCFPVDCADEGCLPGQLCVDGVCVRSSCAHVDCAQGSVCANGYCYPIDCEDHGCSAFGEVCVDGGCIDADCFGVQCPVGQRCARGECFDAGCAMEDCPENQVCVEGRCVRQICVGVDCPPGQRCADGQCMPSDCTGDGFGCGLHEVCVLGRCVPSDCAHTTCDPGMSCGADGACYPEECSGQQCGRYELCVDGECIDQLCVGVSCPQSQVCAGGVCFEHDCSEEQCRLDAVCIDGVCTETQCADCRCCPELDCTMDNQCQTVDCCGVTEVCLFDPIPATPVWSEFGDSCSDGDSCTQDDSCGGDGRCVGKPMVCDAPPADFCDGTTRHSFPPQGRCNDGICEYPADIVECEIDCDDGKCVGPVCGSTRCDQGEQCVSGTCSCSGTGPDCSSSQTCCDGDCVDISSDSENCGACSNPCGLHADCVGGSCECEGTWGNCDGDWSTGCEADTNSDPLHCAACGQPCPTGLNADVSCIDGLCSYTCRDGWMDCDTDDRTCEANVLQDQNNCGACEFRCGPEAFCREGSCVCDDGWANCNQDWADGCEINYLVDVSNCGGCGMPCVGDAHTEIACLEGSCAFSCVDPWIDCDADSSTCERDSSVDPDNCGQCGFACGPDAYCSDGQCVCDEDFDNCDLSWTNGCETYLPTSLENCGGCGRLCSLDHAAETCLDSQCLITGCESPWEDCDNQDATGCERNLDTDVNNCSSCGHVCSLPHASEQCSGGVCLVSSCSSGYWDVDGTPSDGCECADTSDTPGSCSSATYLGAIDRGGSISRTAIMVNIPGVYGDVDCFRVHLQNPAANCTFHLSAGPSSVVVFDGYRNGCDAAYCTNDNNIYSVCTNNCGGGNSGDYTICVKPADISAGTCSEYTVSATCN